MERRTSEHQQPDDAPRRPVPVWTGPPGDERAYRIDEPRQFRRGGLGVVFEAVICSELHGPELVGARVGLKQLTGIDDYRWHRLEERSPKLAQVDHPNLSRHLGVFAGPRPWREGREPDDDDDPQRYIVHLWVEGQALADAVDVDPWSILGWLRQVADGLDDLHAQAGDGDGALDDQEVLDAASRRLRAHGANPEPAVGLLETASAGSAPPTCGDLVERLEKAARTSSSHKVIGRRILSTGALLAAVALAAVVTASRPDPVRPPIDSPPVSSAAFPGMWIGATTEARAGLAGFTAADTAIGPLRYRRCFQAGVPDSHRVSCAKDDWPRYRSFVSLKPPGDDYQGAAEGRYDSDIAAWAASVPTDIGMYATMWYVPERSLTGPQYVAMFRRAYSVVKAANPSIRFGPVYMAYWWQEGSTHYAPGGPDAWWVGSADFVGVVSLAYDPIPLRDDPQFQGWLRFVDAKAPAVPRVIAHYGQYNAAGGPVDPTKQAERARVIAVDEEYLRSRGFAMWLYQQADGWELNDEKSQAAWRRVAATGRTAE